MKPREEREQCPVTCYVILRSNTVHSTEHVNRRSLVMMLLFLIGLLLFHDAYYAIRKSASIYLLGAWTMDARAPVRFASLFVCWRIIIVVSLCNFCVFHYFLTFCIGTF